MDYLLLYDLAPDYLDRRGEFRTEHLALAWLAQSKDQLVIAGALQDPVDMAVLHFRGDSPEAAEEFAKADPYVKHGLVTRWRVRRWATVVGEHAASPINPGFAA